MHDQGLAHRAGWRLELPIARRDVVGDEVTKDVL